MTTTTKTLSVTGEKINSVEFIRKSHPSKNRAEWGHYSDVLLHGCPWSVFVKPDQDNDWVNVKLAATKKNSPKKTNFWLAFNGERFAQSRDFKIAEEHKPDMLEWVSRNYVNFQILIPEDFEIFI